MHVYRYTFSPHVKMPDIEASLLMAFWATEALYGQSDVRLNVCHDLDEDRRTLVIDCESETGRDLNRIFVGFVSREISQTNFSVQRVSTDSASSTAQQP